LIVKQFGNPQISSLQQENTTVIDSISIANTFNAYFSSAAKKLSNKTHATTTASVLLIEK